MPDINVAIEKLVTINPGEADHYQIKVVASFHDKVEAIEVAKRLAATGEHILVYPCRCNS